MCRAKSRAKSSHKPQSAEPAGIGHSAKPRDDRVSLSMSNRGHLMSGLRTKSDQRARCRRDRDSKIEFGVRPVEHQFPAAVSIRQRFVRMRAQEYDGRDLAKARVVVNERR